MSLIPIVQYGGSTLQRLSVTCTKYDKLQKYIPYRFGTINFKTLDILGYMDFANSSYTQPGYKRASHSYFKYFVFFYFVLSVLTESTFTVIIIIIRRRNSFFNKDTILLLLGEGIVAYLPKQIGPTRHQPKHHIIIITPSKDVEYKNGHLFVSS